MAKDKTPAAPAELTIRRAIEYLNDPTINAASLRNALKNHATLAGRSRHGTLEDTGYEVIFIERDALDNYKAARLAGVGPVKRPANRRLIRGVTPENEQQVLDALAPLGVSVEAASPARKPKAKAEPAATPFDETASASIDDRPVEQDGRATPDEGAHETYSDDAVLTFPAFIS